MKVDNINRVYFKSQNSKQAEKPVQYSLPQINELNRVTPDFKINIPQKYTKIGTEELENGLKLHRYKLANGYKVSIVPMEDSPTVVKNYVNVGSMNETSDIKGISHFLEHMAFNGTSGENGHIKLNVGDSFKKIDELGGWANASTNYAITDYVNSSPLLEKGDLEQQIKVIAAMSEDLELSEKMIEKEKGPVCSEINMILDDPQTIALDQTVRTLFDIKNPADEMVGGSVKHIKNLTRDDVLNYYNKYYTPDNMNLVITGDVNPDEVIELVAKNFNSKKVSQGKKFEENLSPIQKTVRKDFISNKAVSSDIILGFAGPRNNDARERIIYNIAKTYLLSQSVGLKQNLKQLNTYPFIKSEKISTNPKSPRMIYLAANVSDEKSEKVLKTIFDTISNVRKPDEKTLNEIKTRILKAKENSLEYSSNVNEMVGKSILNNNLEYVTNYNSILESITPEEVIDGVKKYFDLNKTAITVIHPSKELSFKGVNPGVNTNTPSLGGEGARRADGVNQGVRQPINTAMISEYKVKNGFDVGFYETKNNNITYNISLCTDKPYNKKAGVTDVLNSMYTMGVHNMDESSFNQFKEQNNIELNASVCNNGLCINATSDFDNRNLILENAERLLYAPRFTEENLIKAKDRIKDYLLRKQETAYDQYRNNDAKNNQYEFSDSEVLANIDNITLDDVKDCHRYFIENSRGIVTANIPKEHAEVKDNILQAVSRLKTVLPNKKQELELYKANSGTKVFTKVNNNSQADIMQIHKFKCENTVKETVIAELTNSILSSSSIGLFDTLREKEHLAYSVFSNLEKNGDCGEISCNILTTTDNKEIGEISYDNIQKSINGFNRQIDELKSGKFTDKDLENAKRSMKASLLNIEGTKNKLGNLEIGLNSKYGIKYINKLYKEIDNITKQDIVDFADKIFKNPPIYSIVASKDTLEYNKDYFAALES